jgi:uncharacterized protein (TIGR02001 family)
MIVIKLKETKMRKSLLLIAVLGTLATSTLAFAEDAAKEEKSNWNLTTNFGMVSDYYARGVSQTWHKPTVQGGIDVTHSSGFYAGVFGSGVSPNTYPDANTEIDVYAGYNGEIKAVKGLGYTAGLIGYLYPGGSWDKFSYLGVPNQTPDGGRWNTYEANFGVSYEWISAKASMTLGDWYGAERKTGWDGGTNGTTYLELNAAYPLPWWDLTLIGHVGRLNVAGKLNSSFTAGTTDNLGTVQYPSTSASGEDNPDYTDYKVGVSKAFKIANADGWNAGIYYTGNNNKEYWGKRGYGGASFNGSTETKNLADDRFVFTLSRSF